MSTNNVNERNDNVVVASDSVTAEAVQNAVTDVVSVEKVTPTEVIPLNCQAALASYSAEEQAEILALSDEIDVRKLDNVMSYGAAPLKDVFEQCGEYLKSQSGSHADQEVMKQVIALSKKAKDTYEDFNLDLKEPNILQKLMLKIMSRGKDGGRIGKIQNSAITSYKLLMELIESCQNWEDMLKEAMGDITESAINDMGDTQLLEKYIIAGKIAQDRIEKEMADIQDKYQETGLQVYANEYEEMKQGYDIFVIKMNNLEKSRATNQLSIGQLAMTKRSNRNMQMTIRTQVDHSMALMAQQLRNAVLNAKNNEVLEGQKAITGLNNELLKEVSKTAGLTAEQTEKLLYSGFISVEAIKEGIQAVVNSCETIQKTGQEMLPKMKADVDAINSLMEELSPYVNSIELKGGSSTTTEPTLPAGKDKLGF